MKIRVNTGPWSNIFQEKHYISWLVYGLSTLLMVMLQASPRIFPIILGVRPSPLIAFTICVSVLGGARTGVTVGTLAGLLYGLFSTHIFGFDALMFMILCLVSGLLVEWILRANIYTALLLSSCGIVLYSMIEWIFCYVIPGYTDVATLLFKVILPSGLYTIIITPLIYWFSLQLARYVRRRVNN